MDLTAGPGVHIRNKYSQNETACGQATNVLVTFIIATCTGRSLGHITAKKEAAQDRHRPQNKSCGANSAVTAPR